MLKVQIQVIIKQKILLNKFLKMLKMNSKALLQQSQLHINLMFKIIRLKLSKLNNKKKIETFLNLIKIKNVY